MKFSGLDIGTGCLACTFFIVRRTWAKNNRPGHQSGAVGQISIENELLCCVVTVASAGTAVTAAASASAAVVTALA